MACLHVLHELGGQGRLRALQSLQAKEQEDCEGEKGGKAREQAAAPFGGLGTPEGARAADAVDPRRFRHAGPKPQSREAALIMLADGVEASVRALSSRDEPAIRAMVERIIEERLSDGQFDECDLTLRDLERIREAFVAQLRGMYHQRVAYPESKVVELESRRGAGGRG